MTARRRSGFTLVELMVVMSIIVVLASITVLVVPDIMSQDRTTEAAGRLQQYLQTAKNRAARDGLPRGVQLINNGSGLATEVQYVEAPPLFLPNPDQTGGFPTPNGSPQVLFEFTSGNPTPTKITLNNLPDPSVVTAESTVLIPNLQAYFQVATATPSGSTVTVTAKGSPQYPNVGVGTKAVSYLFGVYGPVQALLGEPVVQLPANVGVDLNSSDGILSPYIVLFSPSGDVVDATKGQMMLWVRDPRKGGGSTGNLQTGGEQQVVAVKARSGAVGVFPISWTANNPFEFAKAGATGP